MSVHQTKDGRWYVSYRDKYGSQHKIYTGRGLPAKREAEAIDYQIKAAKKRGEEIERQAGKIYLDELARLYLEDREAVCSESYIYDMRRLLNNHILPKCSHCPADDLTYEDIMKAMEVFRSRSIATRNRYMGYLRALFNWGIKHDFISKTPLKAWSKAKEPKIKVRLTAEDLAKIMQYAPPHLKWAIEVEWNLGTRPGHSELFSLKWENVDFENNQVWVYASKTKTWRVIPITGHFRQRLLEMKKAARTEYIIEYRGRPVKQLRHSFKTACKKAGINYRVRMYDIRHLFASLILAGGGDLAAVSALLGHQDIATTQKAYYELLRGEKERAISLLPRLGETVPGGHDRKEEDEEMNYGGGKVVQNSNNSKA